MNSIHSHIARRIIPLTLTLVLSGTASAAVIFPKVTNTNDTGSGSLRAAITAANANGSDGAIIDFQIGSSCGPHVIHLNTALPDIQFETHIEGYAQPGSSANTAKGFGNDAVICIVLAGDNAVDDGFSVPSTVADAMTFSVQGIAFSGFTHSAVNLRGGSQHLVSGIRTGGTIGGFAMDSNSYGVILAAGVHGSQIGGPDIDGENQFGDIVHNAVYVASSNGSSNSANNNTIAYNNVGFVLDGTTETKLPTGGAGIAVGGSHNSLYSDILKYAGAAGLHISNTDAHDNAFFLSGTAFNDGDGVLIDDDAHDNLVQNNSISSNAGAGIRVVNGQGNDLTINNIDGNGALGIDLATAGVTANDNDSMPPTADYANRGQNFPILDSARGGHTGVITGTLTTTPGKYYIDLQVTSTCDASGYGQGSNGPDYTGGTTGYVTVPNLTVQGQGSVGFSLPVAFSFYISKTFFVTATATDAANNTSEFTQCIPYVDDTIFFDNFE